MSNIDDIVNSALADLKMIRSRVKEAKETNRSAKAVIELRDSLVSEVSRLNNTQEKRDLLVSILSRVNSSLDVKEIELDEINQSETVTKVLIEAFRSQDNTIKMDRSDGSSFSYGKTTNPESVSLLKDSRVSSMPTTDTPLGISINDKGIYSKNSCSFIGRYDLNFINPIIVGIKNEVNSIEIMVADKDGVNDTDNIIVLSMDLLGHVNTLNVIHVDPITLSKPIPSGFNIGIWNVSFLSEGGLYTLGFNIYDKVLEEYRWLSHCSIREKPINITPFSYYGKQLCIVEYQDTGIQVFGVDSKNRVIKQSEIDAFSNIRGAVFHDNCILGINEKNNIIYIFSSRMVSN